MSADSNIKLGSETKRKDQVGRFHMRQAFYLLFVFAGLVIAFLIMLAKQYDLVRKHEEEILLKHFSERIAHFDNLLARVTENVNMMRIAAEADLLQSRTLKNFTQPFEFRYFTDIPKEKRYHLDTFDPPVTRETVGNLTGHGSIKNRSTDFYREIHMALALNPLFQAAAGAIKNSAWVYYTSKDNFINIYPWVSSDDFKFSKELYTHEFYTLGLQQNNPDRNVFWTKVYIDEYGKGLMTTCAAPVYDHNRFVGTVAIDLTIDFLNTMVRKFNPERGVMLLINDKEQVLAHPTLVTSEDRNTKTLDEILPEEIKGSTGHIRRIRNNEITPLGHFNILRCDLNQAPWQVMYIEKTNSFWDPVVRSLGTGPAILLSMLFILVITLFAMTHIQFIVPSKKFVNYIMARSQRLHTQMDRGIPRVWKPWFTAVENVFRDNENLTKELREQNENLEERVQQRTDELKQEIEERKQIQENLRKSEERFRDISYSMADWIWEVDREGKYTFASETVKQILGYGSEELIEKTPFDLCPEDEATRIREIFEGLYARKEPIIDLENWNLSKEGKRVCLLTNGVPILGEDGVLTGYRGVDKDITLNKVAEQEQKRLEAQLQRAEKMESIGTLAGGVAHDLNNILSGIVAYPDLLLMQLPDDSPLREFIADIKESGVKAAAIVQDLLTLARRGVATTEIVNLSDIVNKYLGSPEHKQLLSFHPHVGVKADLDEDLLNIMGSRVHLSKTIFNLVSNAAEAMPDGGEIMISTQNRYIDRPEMGYEEMKEGDYVTLTVSDPGVGISIEDKERIFEPFYTKKIMGRSGTGLGMAVVWGTVKDHKGYIDIQSTVGRGSTFTLFFPANREKANQNIPEISINDYMGNGESILVVDDVKQQREIATVILSQLGYQSNAVSSGEEAVEHIKMAPVDLLVLDMIMEPGIDGLDTYRKILEICPKQRAIIASGFSETDRVKEAQRLGAGEYVTKPYTMEKIGIAVKRELENA